MQQRKLSLVGHLKKIVAMGILLWLVAGIVAAV
jgi:hypothetical protein